MPRVSPKKTWSGALAGIVAAILVAVAIARFAGLAGLVPIAVLAVLLSIVAQAGDLFEVRPQAPVRGQGFEPAHSGARRADGSPRRFRGGGLARRPDRIAARRHSRRPGAACWCGDAMKSQTLRATPERSAPAFADRTVTLLGATGSIGASTIDLLKRERERYRVEAVSANRSAAALAALARELGARFAAVGDPAAYARAQGCARRHRHRGRGRRERADRGGPASGRLGDRRDHRRGRAQADAGRRRARRDRRARQQGNAWSVPAACSCAGRRQPARPCCRSIPSTTPCSRR